MHLAQGSLCPQCRRNLPEIAAVGNTCECPYCGTQLRFSDRNAWISLVFGFAWSLTIVHSINLQAWAGILWIPTFLLCQLVSALFTSLFLGNPLAIDKGCFKKHFYELRMLPFFISMWIGLTLLMAAYGYFLGWAGIALGASHQEIQEQLDFWSMPLGFSNSAFIVTADKPFVTDLGIIAANSYFYAFGLTILLKVVHTILQRSRVIQLSISGTEIGDDDDDL